MDIRPRDPELIRRDALKMARTKSASGCASCAEGYLNLARENGASEDELRKAMDLIEHREAHRPMSRRNFLSVAGAGAATLTAVAAGGALIQEFVPGEAAAAATPIAAGYGADSNAWIVASDSTGSLELLGIDPAGNGVGQITLEGNRVLRSEDGTLIYVVSAQPSDATRQVKVQIYAAADGVLTRTITGEALSVGAASGLDSIEPALSSDGAYIAVLHLIEYVVRADAEQVTKTGIDGTSYTISLDETYDLAILEIIDVINGVSLGTLPINSSGGTIRGGYIQFLAGGDAVIVLALDDHFAGSAFVASFNSGGLYLNNQARDGQPNHSVPPVGSQRSRNIKALPGTSQLVIFDPAGDIQWFDVNTLTILQEMHLDFGVVGNKGYSLTPAFSPDISELYIVRPDRGSIKGVNTENASVTAQSTATATSSVPPAGRVWPTPAAAITPDGTQLLMVDAVGGGIRVVSLPELSVVAHWIPGLDLSSLWISPDGRTIYGSGGEAGTFYVLSTQGTVVGAIQTDMQLGDFAFSNN